MKNPSILLPALLLLVPSFIGVLEAQPLPWKELPFSITSAAFYDVDGDGVLEAILLPSHIMKSYVVMRSPYPAFTRITLMDIDLDGRLEVVLFNTSTGDYYTYRGLFLLDRFRLPAGEPLINLERTALSVGNTVLFNSSVYRFENAEGAVYPLIVRGRLVGIYGKGDMLVVEPVGARPQAIFSYSKILGAGVSLNGDLMIVTSPPMGGVSLIIYNWSSFRVVSYNVSISAVVARIPYTDYFIAYGEGRLYLLGADKISLEAFGDTIGFDGTHVYLLFQGRIRAYSISSKTIVLDVSSPVERPQVFAASYPFMVIATATRTFVYVATPIPVASFSAPSSVYVYEKFEYSVSVSGAQSFSLTLNGIPLPVPRGSVSINTTGTHVFSVYATNGVIEAIYNYTVLVKPRPLMINMRVFGAPTLFESANITIETRDGLNGTLVVTRCAVKSASGSVNATSWDPFFLLLLPERNQTTVPISIVCGGDGIYEEKLYETVVPASPATPVLVAEYLGNGTLRIFFISPGGYVNATGRVTAYVSGKQAIAGSTPLVIRDLAPGNHTLTIYFYPDLPVFRPATYQVNLTYFGDISQAPTQIYREIFVADRIVAVNRTVETTVTVTYTQATPRYIAVPTLDTTMLVIFSAVSATAGGALGYLYARRARGGEEERGGEEFGLEKP